MVVDSNYVARCHKRLKKWDAPLENWYCFDVIDTADDHDNDAVSICELCDCQKVRFVHVMRHEDYFEDVRVGCVCAGIMEGEVLVAKERDRMMRNRAKRRLNFPRRKWKENKYGGYYLSYKGKPINIIRSRFNSGHFGVRCKGASVWQYKGRPIDNFISAAYAAFDLVDPVERIWNI